MEDDPGDVDLYLAMARRTGGPILELAVGTGRIAVPLAAAGYPVTGVDRDPAMLDRARERAVAAELGGRPGGRLSRRTARGTLELVEGDIVALRLPTAGSFRMAFIALNSLLLLDTRAAQRSAFTVLADHLASGGLAIVDTWLPAAADLARFDGRLGLEHARPDPVGGDLVTKLSSAQHDSTSHVVSLTTIYEVGAQGAPPKRWVRTDRLRLLSADDLVGLAEAAGLVVEQVAGGYDLEPLAPSSERAILVARRP
jgi:SAM-dependent methyltransferase